MRFWRRVLCIHVLLLVAAFWVGAVERPLLSASLYVNASGERAVAVTLELQSSAYPSVQPTEVSYRILFAVLSVRVVSSQ